MKSSKAVGLMGSHRGPAMGRLAILFGSLSLALTLSGCGMGKGAATASKAETASGGYGYLTAPYLTSVEVTAASVLVHGKSGRGARVRLSSPDGQAYGATATDAGVWVIEVPVQGLKGGADLFGLSEDFNGRIVQAEGYVALLSNRAIPAVLLRAGTGAETLTGGGPLRIGAVDFDDAGGVTVSGAAKAGEALKASLDGVMAAEGRVNDQGRYSFSLTGVARPGAHQIGVRSAQSASTRPRRRSRRRSGRHR